MVATDEIIMKVYELIQVVLQTVGEQVKNISILFLDNFKISK